MPRNLPRLMREAWRRPGTWSPIRRGTAEMVRNLMRCKGMVGL
jgi:hypothetical protein